MRLARFFLFLLISPVSQAAEYLEVKRAASIHAEPAKRSAKLLDVVPASAGRPLLFELASSTRSQGYYSIYLPNSGKKGWIYKTYVRRHPGPEPRYTVYLRSLYKHWIDVDNDCQDSRQEVLIRDSIGRVNLDTAQCVVKQGQWVDPYTGKSFREPRQLDVDHMVPLKNAHESGAWKWSAEKRQEFANYLADRRHLLAVKASENRKKGAKGPDRYLPPDSTLHCEYVQDWVRIKRTWGLSLTASEQRSVTKISASCAS